jgi:hypothetical protein
MFASKTFKLGNQRYFQAKASLGTLALYCSYASEEWGFVSYIALANFIKTNQNPNSVRRSFAPPHTIWVLCPNKNGDSYTINSHDLHCLLRGQYRSWLCFFNYAEVLIQYSIETLYISEKYFSGRYGDRTPDPDFISAPEHCSGISLTYLRSQQKLVT